MNNDYETISLVDYFNYYSDNTVIFCKNGKLEIGIY